MIFRTHSKPLILGGLMGLMMLAMVHMMLTSDNAFGGMALLAFVGAHVAIVLGIATLAWWGARFSPSLQVKLTKLHRPDAIHVAAMLIAAALTALSAHTVLHWGV